MSTAAFLMLELIKWKCFYVVHAEHNNVIKWPTAGLGGGGWEFHETIKETKGANAQSTPIQHQKYFFKEINSM